MKLTRQIIKNICGTTYYKRGLNYFSNNKVQHLEVEEDTDNFKLLYAMVKGNARDPYLLDIIIESEEERFSSSSIEIEGRCSCPIGYNCKHVVAACLKYIDTAEMFPNQAPNSLKWLESLAREKETIQPDSRNQIQILTFFIDESDEKGLFELNAKYSYYKQNGGLIKPRKLSHSISYASELGEFQRRDIEALKMMEVLAIRYGNTAMLTGAVGAHLLQHIVESGQCYWKIFDEDHPLQIGPPETLELNWKQVGKGNIQLQPSIGHTSAQLMLLQPTYYIDIERLLIGPVDSTMYSDSQLERILNAPIIPATSIEKLSRELAVSYPELNIPQPIPVSIREVTDENMKPQLTLSMYQLDHYNFPVLKLEFNYANFLIEMNNRDPVSVIEKGSEVIQVQRNLLIEDTHVNTVIDMGFKQVSRRGESFFYRQATNTIESATHWYHFMEEGIPRLEADGWDVRFAESYDLSFVRPDDWSAELEATDNNWFELHFDMDINGENYDMVPLIAQVLDNYLIGDIPESLAIPTEKHDFVVLEKQQIMPIVQTLYELFNYKPAGDKFRINTFDAAQLAELESQHEQLQIKGGQKLLALGKKLRNHKGIDPVSLPVNLNATLRDYQQKGVDWLQFLREYQLNGILADDMGLGKTVQVLTHLLIEKDQGRLQHPCLIIAPTSLMSNWRREAERFTPDLKVLTLQGAQRHERFDRVNDYDIILSTYPLLSRDHEQLKKHEWHTVVLDEAQMVKNPKSRAAKTIRELQANHRLCLTGTPMENHLGELWSLFDFLMPGFLADEKTFNHLFRKPIEHQGDQMMAKALSKRVAPFLLRRTKGNVLKDLPDKSELIRSVQLNDAQSKLYESIRISMEKKVKSAIAKNGLARSHITILDALLKLRQVCCDPRLLKLSQAKKVKRSAKLELLMDMLPEMLEEGRRVLIFSQFTSMLSLIEPELKEQGILYSKLTGQTRKREEVIDEFKSGQTDVFLISLKAGGLGLNLTEADSVIIYDPWWNPAIESQAADRTHRIGQNKSVFVYKLIVENSVEEKILQLQEKKRQLAEGVYGEDKIEANSLFNASDISQLFAPLNRLTPGP